MPETLCAVFLYPVPLLLNVMTELVDLEENPSVPRSLESQEILTFEKAQPAAAESPAQSR